MKLIEPSVELIKQQPGVEGMYKQVEFGARLCYRSEDKITDDSYAKMIEMLCKNGHLSPLQHGTVYLVGKHLSHYIGEPYSIVQEFDNVFYVTTNLQVLYEHDWMDDLQYFQFTDKHVERKSVLWVCSRAIAQECTRHKSFSFCMESQRYCNYSRDKFDGQIKFIRPLWYNPKEYKEYNITYLNSLRRCEREYMDLLHHGLRPEEAREVLCNSCATTLLMTGDEWQWQNFINQRTAPAAHPEMRRLANQLNGILYD